MAVDCDIYGLLRTGAGISTLRVWIKTQGGRAKSKTEHVFKFLIISKLNWSESTVSRAGNRSGSMDCCHCLAATWVRGCFTVGKVVVLTWFFTWFVVECWPSRQGGCVVSCGGQASAHCGHAHSRSRIATNRCWGGSKLKSISRRTSVDKVPTSFWTR